MASKTVKIQLEENGEIKIFNNDELKITICTNDNQIKGQDIYDSLNVEIGDDFILEPIQEDIGNQRYKTYQMIHSLYSDILDSIKTKDEDMSFDVDVSDFQEIG